MVPCRLPLPVLDVYLLFRVVSFGGGNRRSERLMSALGSAIGMLELAMLLELRVAAPVPVSVAELPGVLAVTFVAFVELAWLLAPRLAEFDLLSPALG